MNFTIHVDFRRIIWSQHSIALLNLTLTSWFLARWTASIFLNISVNPIISPEFSPNHYYLESHNFTYHSRYSSRFPIGSRLPRLILHNHLALTKFGRRFAIYGKWHQYKYSISMRIKNSNSEALESRLSSFQESITKMAEYFSHFELKTK